MLSLPPHPLVFLSLSGAPWPLSMPEVWCSPAFTQGSLFSCHISSLSEMPPLVPMLISSCYVPSPGISPEPSPTYITAYQTSLLGSHRPTRLHSSKHDSSPFSNPSQPSSLYYSGSAACQESRQEPGAILAFFFTLTFHIMVHHIVD